MKDAGITTSVANGERIEGKGEGVKRKGVKG
jgi:hypothetical protein